MSYSKWTIKGNSLCAAKYFNWNDSRNICSQLLLVVNKNSRKIKILLYQLTYVPSMECFNWILSEKRERILSSEIVTYSQWLFIEEYFASVWAQLKSWTITLISLDVGLICTASQPKWVKVFYWRSRIPSTAFKWGLWT